VQARDMIVEMKHPTLAPSRSSASQSSSRHARHRPHARPVRGEHTEASLRELGMNAADMKALREKKIVG